TSSPPIADASRNMSACSLQAVSQVGCRLMVASSAKMSRPRKPVPVAGVRRLTSLRNALISARVEVGAISARGDAAALLVGSGLARLLSSGRRVMTLGQYSPRRLVGHHPVHPDPKVAPRAPLRNAPSDDANQVFSRSCSPSGAIGGAGDCPGPTGSASPAI